MKKSSSRYNVSVTMRPNNGAVVKAKDEASGRAESYEFTQREVDLMTLAASGSKRIVNRILAEYALNWLFAPELKEKAMSEVSNQNRMVLNHLDLFGCPPPVGPGCAPPAEGASGSFSQDVPLLGSKEPPMPPVAEKPHIETPREKLQRELEEAVRREDYTAATELRDRLRSMEND